MATAVVLPRLGLTMIEGTIEKWLKKEGDRIEKGEPLVCIQTEKVSYEYESPASGVLRKIVREVNEVVPVSETIAIIGSAEEDISALLPLQLPPRERKEEKPMVMEGEIIPSEGRRILASPFAKKIAQEKGVDLSRVLGTGPGGRITKDDVVNFARKRKRKGSPCDVGNSVLRGDRGSRDQTNHRAADDRECEDHPSSLTFSRSRHESTPGVSVTHLEGCRKGKGGSGFRDRAFG